MRRICCIRRAIRDTADPTCSLMCFAVPKLWWQSSIQGQILESRQRWTDEDMERFFPKARDASIGGLDAVRFVEGNMDDLPIRHARIRLHHQFRIAANPSTVEWLEKLVQEGEIGPLPVDRGKHNPRAAERGQSEWIYEPFDLRVFDSPVALMDGGIRAKAKLQADGAEGKGLSRVLATYDWPYKGKGENPDTRKILAVNGVWRCIGMARGGMWVRPLAMPAVSKPMMMTISIIRGITRFPTVWWRSERRRQSSSRRGPRNLTRIE